jgi:hypothetical protein
MIHAHGFVCLVVAVVALIIPDAAGGQEPTVIQGVVVADTVRIEGEALAAGVPAVPYDRTLATGEGIAVRVENEVVIGRPGIEARPVFDAPVGAVVARFEGSGVFAWPERPFVWTAPSPGRLVFGINAYGAHEPRGRARVVAVPLGSQGSGVARAFPSPLIELERVPQGVVVHFSDRAGFGIVPSTLRLTLTTSRGTEYRLAPWATPGEIDTFLPLPPPAIDLPPGVHTLSATVEDWLGNVSEPATIAFDTAQ